jgi:predicted permease
VRKAKRDTAERRKQSVRVQGRAVPSRVRQIESVPNGLLMRLYCVSPNIFVAARLATAVQGDSHKPTLMTHDFRIALRSLLRAPGFAAAGVLTLAVAIGMATSVFTIVNALLLRPLPYAHADRLALLWTDERSGDARGPNSFDDFTDWTRNSLTLDSAALFSSYYKPILTGSGRAERLASLLVSHDYFNVMSVHPYLGRFFLPAEDRDGPDDVVVLSYPLWRERFHSDLQIVGHTILLDARVHTVVGVAPPDMPLLPPSLASEPVQLYRALGENFGPGSRDGHHLESIVRLRAGVSIEQAQADLDVRTRDMERAHPVEDAHLAARIVNLRDDMTRNVRTGLVALQGAVLTLVLIACANIANLLLAKSSARRREMAIRSALGAGTVRLARMLLSESLVLGLAGGAAGILLAWWSASALTAVAVRVLPDAGHILLDLRVLAFSIALSLAAAILFGVAPILRLGDTTRDDGLRLGARVAGDRRNRLRQLLAAGQIALALMLLVAAGLLGRSFLRLRSVNPGFEPRGVVTASVALPRVRYAKPGDVTGTTLAIAAAWTPGVARNPKSVRSKKPLNGDFDRTNYMIEGRISRPGELGGALRSSEVPNEPGGALGAGLESTASWSPVSLVVSPCSGLGQESIGILRKPEVGCGPEPAGKHAVPHACAQGLPWANIYLTNQTAAR